MKKPKAYDHVPILMAEVLQRRANDSKTVTRKIEISPSKPVNLTPTIALKESPITAVLVDAKLSRIKKIRLIIVSSEKLTAPVGSNDSV